MYYAPPNISGFTNFIRDVMGIPTAVLPDDSPVIAMALCVAIDIVALSFIQISPLIYVLMVYNLAGDNLINYAQDQADAPNIEGSNPSAPYFRNLRQRWNINGFAPGVVISTSDQGTSAGLVVQEAARNFTLADLQNLKTPWGRTYLGFAQKYGTIWGVS